MVLKVAEQEVYDGACDCAEFLCLHHGKNELVFFQPIILLEPTPPQFDELEAKPRSIEKMLITGPQSNLLPFLPSAGLAIHPEEFLHTGHRSFKGLRDSLVACV
eukprot:3076751-Rhodomonas_salina.1